MWHLTHCHTCFLIKLWLKTLAVCLLGWPGDMPLQGPRHSMYANPATIGSQRRCLLDPVV